ncbi:MAG: hypothetical protein IJ663_04255 [Spirochaetales bacterium]|nr:hypothetical protein [Spirochaetales bacterium]
MKRTLAIILVAVLVASCAFAATSTKFTKYGNIFKSHEYTLKGTSYEMGSNGSKTGTGSPVYVSEHAGSYYMEVSAEGESMRILIMDGKYYLISDSDKSVISMAYEEGDDDIMTFPSSYEVLGSGNGKLDGKSYYYENAKEADGTISTYWYNGNDLYAIQSVDSIIYIESVSQKADASKFAVPQGYDVIDMSDLASLFGDFSSDDWYSDDSSSSWDNWDSYTGDDWAYDSSDSWWDDDTDYSPNYYALGQYFGLTEAQAEEFSTAMYAVQYMDWGTLNEYVTSGKFDFKGKKLENFTDLTSYEITALQKLVQGFKK